MFAHTSSPRPRTPTRKKETITYYTKKTSLVQHTTYVVIGAREEELVPEAEAIERSTVTKNGSLNISFTGSYAWRDFTHTKKTSPLHPTLVRQATVSVITTQEEEQAAEAEATDNSTVTKNFNLGTFSHTHDYTKKTSRLHTGVAVIVA